MAEIDEVRQLVQSFWCGAPLICSTHTGAKLSARFVESTWSDHITFRCERGETLTIVQRPRQKEFNAWQSEGLVVFLERGDNVLCFRCQSKLEVERKSPPGSPEQHYLFTCVRCYSWGSWEGDPAKASIEAPIATSNA